MASPRVRRGFTQNMVSALIVFAGAVPFAGWTLPGGWLVVTLALMLCDRRWRAQRRAAAPRFRLFEWLLSFSYSVAAFYLVFMFRGAAQTLGVTLYGVLLFQIMARDYAQPWRMIANLAPPVALVVLVQTAAAANLIEVGLPWQIVTLVASPFVVFRAFRVVHANLERHLGREREVADQLRESEARYRLIAESSPDVILRYDIEGHVEYLSPAARLYGWNPDDLTGANLARSLHPDELERNAAFMADLAAGRPTPQGKENVWRTRTPDGRSITFEGRSSPVIGTDGRVLGAVAVMRDVTDRLALEDELRRKQAESEAASLAKSAFLATVSHEIRTPLNGVLGMAQAMARDELPLRQSERLQVITRSGETLLALLNDILDLSKIEAGKLELEVADVDLAQIVLGAEAAFAANAEMKGLRLATRLSEDLRGLWRGDAVRLRQVLYNLVSNAVKFTESGEVVIEAETTPDGVRIAVRDTGVGIPAGSIAGLFRKFVQADSSTTRRFGGTGLGLAISAELCQAMGGTITVASTMGAGSVFTVLLPLERAPAGATAVATAEAVGSHLGGAWRVLAAEDNRVNQLVLQTLLGQLGIEPVMVENGAMAVEAWRREPWDLILMDVQMPTMDGPTAARAIRTAEAADGRARTPIVALTANAMTHQLADYLAAGMDAVVAKPIRVDELFAAIQSVTASPQAAPLAAVANG